MIPPVVTGGPVDSKILFVGQAPGDKEGKLGKPFAWTAGKTLFKWFAPLGFTEDQFRSRIHMSAVCRCFPGKNPKGGDRVPSPTEVQNCATWLQEEIRLLRPTLVIPCGKLAINQFLPVDKLNAVVGKTLKHQMLNLAFDLVALPHPSGASTWHRKEPGISLLHQALRHIGKHPAIRDVLR